MAGPVLKKRKLLEPIFTEFRRKDSNIGHLRESFDLFRNGGNDMKFRFLEIVESNARSDVSFSDASCTVKSYKRTLYSDTQVPEVYLLSSLFSDGIMILKMYLEENDNFMLPVDGQCREALRKLITFFSTSYKYLKPKTDGQTDCEWAVQLAEHLLSELAVGSKYTIKHQYSKNTIKLEDGKFYCPCGPKHLVEKGTFGDTSFGCTDAWNGSVDILLEDTSVKLSDTSGNSGSAESFSDVESPSSVQGNIEHQLSWRGNDKILAQSIVFSFLQHKRVPDSEDFLIPSLAFNRDKVKVTFYDCEHDVLLQTCDLALFNCNVPDGTTIVFLWMVLNYRYLCSGLTDPMKAYKAKFFDRAGDFLSKYNNDITRPVAKATKQSVEENWFRSAGKYSAHPPKVTFLSLGEFEHQA